MAFDLNETVNETHSFPVKASQSVKCVGLLATSKNVIACYSKFMTVLCVESGEFVAVEPMTAIYTCALVDEKTVAVSCKASNQALVVTYSLESLFPTSVSSTPVVCRLLMVNLVG